MKDLSRIIAGTMNWGVWHHRLTRQEMAERIALCVELGIYTFDHADIYGGYTTEAEFGQALHSSGISRDSVALISKCGIKHLSGNHIPTRQYRVKHYDYSEHYILWSVAQSLINLKTDYLDVLLLHRPSPLMEAEVVASAVMKLKQQGKILSFGVSNFTPSQTRLISRAVPVSYNQISFSATDHLAMTDGTLDYMQTSGIVPMAWSPLGDVFRADTHQNKGILTLLDRLSKKYACTTSALLIAWILRHPAQIHPVCGTANPERLRAFAKASDINLDLEDWFEIWETSRGQKIP
jgi:predicted oxidoreductase